MLRCVKNKFNLLRNFFYSPVIHGKEYDNGDGGSNIFDKLWQCVHTLISFYFFLFYTQILFDLCSNPDAERFHPNLGENI